jgi:hypothetical protein
VNALYGANFTPIDDAYINFYDGGVGGDKIWISVDDRPSPSFGDAEGFFAFNMTLPENSSVVNANFTDCFDWLTVDLNHNGFNVYLYEINQSWDENTINWTNKPPYGDYIFSYGFPYGNGQKLNWTWDVLPIALKHQNDGYVSFAITPYTGANYVGYLMANSKDKPADNSVSWNGTDWVCTQDPYQYCPCLVSGYYPPIMSVDYSICGDDICEGNENYQNCCQDCGVTPTSDLEITSSGTYHFCNGTYIINDTDCLTPPYHCGAIEIMSDNVDIECNGTEIVGVEPYDVYKDTEIDGIYEMGHSNVTINGCKLKTWTIGIASTGGYGSYDNVTIENNDINDALYAIWLDGGYNHVFRGNNFYNNTGNYIVYVDNSNGVTFINNTIDGNYGVYLRNGTDALVQYNNISSDIQYRAVRLVGFNNTLVENNTLYNGSMSSDIGDYYISDYFVFANNTVITSRGGFANWDTSARTGTIKNNNFTVTNAYDPVENYIFKTVDLYFVPQEFSNNIANGLPLYYHKDISNQDITEDTMYVMCQNCQNVTFKNMNMQNGSSMFFSDADVKLENVKTNQITYENSNITGRNVVSRDSDWGLDGSYPSWHQYFNFTDSMFIGLTENYALYDTTLTCINCSFGDDESLYYIGDSTSEIWRYWYVNLTTNNNPIAIVKDSKDNTLFSGVANDIDLVGLEYVETCPSDCYHADAVRDYYINYTFNATAIKCNPLFESFNFTTNYIKSYGLSCMPTQLNDTLSDVGEGVGNLLLGMSPPLAIFIIILSVTAMFGFIFSSFGKKTGEGI